MKFLKEIIGLIFVALFFFYIKSYREGTNQERFKIMTNSDGFDSLFDSKTNLIYIQIPHRGDRTVFFYEQSDYYKNRYNAKKFTGKDLLKFK